MNIFTLFILFLVLATSESIEENYLPKFNLKSGFYNVESIQLEIKLKIQKLSYIILWTAQIQL